MKIQQLFKIFSFFSSKNNHNQELIDLKNLISCLIIDLVDSDYDQIFSSGKSGDAFDNFYDRIEKCFPPDKYLIFAPLADGCYPPCELLIFFTDRRISVPFEEVEWTSEELSKIKALLHEYLSEKNY